MKKIVLLLAFAATLTSCSVVRTQTSRSMNVDSSVTSNTAADLNVAQTKISYKYVPSRKEGKGMSEANIKSKAVANALKDNGSADVLVATQYEIVKRRGFLSFVSRTREVIVTGYPATYRNFTVQSEQ